MKGWLIASIIAVVGLLVLGFFVLTNNKNTSNENNGSQIDSNQMVDCGKMQNPTCFSNRMSGCLPVTAELTGTDGSDINMTILGYENGKCHFQRKVNGVVNLNCYFPNETSLTWNLIDQTFGNDIGLQNVVDANCYPA